MQTKSLLRTAASLLVIAALSASGCATPTASTATTTTAPAPAAQAAPTVAEAQAFIDDAERQLTALNERAARVSWMYNTDITYDTEWLNQRSDAEST
ncbi:MAG: peptidase M2 family protein, partial [Pseudomonadota bacterium]